MKALVHKQKDSFFELTEVPDPVPKSGEVIVELAAAALNRRDYYITKGLYPGIQYPVILGSDGAGTQDGKKVLLNPAIQWGDNPEIPSRQFEILGMPRNGTFAQKIAIPKTQVYPIPSHLSMEEAAALPLAGLTAYRALFTKGNCHEGQRVLINGIGGGVAAMAFRFALAAGAEVCVTSSSPDKRNFALDNGAKAAYDYTEPGWWKAVKESSKRYFDLIIDSAGGSGFAGLVHIAAPAGRIVTYGGTRGKIDGLSPQLIFWRQIHILGTSMGNDTEFQEMLDFVEKQKVNPVIDKEFALEEATDAMHRLAENKQCGKIILAIR